MVNVFAFTGLILSVVLFILSFIPKPVSVLESDLFKIPREGRVVSAFTLVFFLFGLILGL